MNDDDLTMATRREIETERLLMRPHRPEEFLDCASLWADPVVVEHTIGRPATEEESWTRFLRYVGHWSVLGFGYWTLRDKASDRFLGEVGFADYRRAVEPPLGDAPEIGWVLMPSAHGQGFAREAVAAATRWGDARFAGRSTVCIITPGHTRSIRVAERAGYRKSHGARYHGREMIVFRRDGA